MKYEEFFYSPIQIKDNFDIRLAAVLEQLKDCWEPYGRSRTLMYSTTDDAELATLENIDNPAIDKHTTLFKDVYNFLEQGQPLPAKLDAIIRFFKLPAGERFTPHYDNPKCAIIFHFNKPDPISFYDEKGDKIYEATYKFALLNTSIKHGIEETLTDRIWFKISISRFSYFQMREILYLRGLLSL